MKLWDMVQPLNCVMLSYRLQPGRLVRVLESLLAGQKRSTPLPGLSPLASALSQLMQECLFLVLRLVKMYSICL